MLESPKKWSDFSWKWLFFDDKIFVEKIIPSLRMDFESTTIAMVVFQYDNILHETNYRSKSTSGEVEY